MNPDCIGSATPVAMDLLYPKPGATIYIPKDLDGSEGRALFQLAHRSANTTVFWHMDGDYIGSTKKTHQLSLSTGFGAHSMTLVDDQGEIMTFTFNVLSNP